jgi:ABC-type antimicrobial peptide transport system permease subunit
VVGDSILKNKHWKVGDKIGSNVDSTERLKGEYEIVGSLKSNGKAAASGIGSLNYLEKSGNKDFVFFLIRPKAGKLDSLNEDLKMYKNDKLTQIATKVEIEKSVKEFSENIDLLLWALNIIIVTIITFAVSLLNIIFFMQRANEFGLLAALGYSRRFILFRTFLESVFLIIFGWFLGIFLSEAIYHFISKMYFEPKGLATLTVLEIRTLLFSIPVPIAVAVFSIGTVFWQILRLDPVSIIERRD